MNVCRLLTFAALAIIVGACGNDADPPQIESQTQNSPPDSEIEISGTGAGGIKADDAGHPQDNPVSPHIRPLPSHMAFDPCALIAIEDAPALNIPVDQRTERIGGTRKIPGDHRYTPYVGCVWRNVVQGVPRVAVDVQQGAEGLEANGDPVAGVGDAAWYGERNGRAELRVHKGGYVIFVRAELLQDHSDSRAAHAAIGKYVASALESPASTRQLAPDTSQLGGPHLNVCKAAGASGIADLLPGPEVWAFPTAAINRVADEQNPKPDPDYIGCNFAGAARGSVLLRFLGSHGVKRQLSLYSNQTPVTINGLEGFRKRSGLYLPYGDGAFELIATMTPFDKQLLPQKLETIMRNVVDAVKQ